LLFVVGMCSVSLLSDMFTQIASWFGCCFASKKGFDSRMVSSRIRS
jgi:hypothetical protein